MCTTSFRNLALILAIFSRKKPQKNIEFLFFDHVAASTFLLKDMVLVERQSGIQKCYLKQNKANHTISVSEVGVNF